MEMKKFTRLSLLLALSIVLNMIESIVPLFNGFIPGLKLGLANIVVIFVLYNYSFKDALYLTVLRVILVSMLRTGLFSVAFFFSLGGAVLSLITMCLVKKYTKLSLIGISIVGSITHSLGQIIIAYFFIHTTGIIFYLPWLLMFSIPTGIVTGKLSNSMIDNFKNLNHINASLY